MQLTKDERIFARRMAAHVEAGKSFEEAARAVLSDDERIWKTICAYQYSSTRRGEQGDIQSELSNHVYRAIRLQKTVGDA